MRTILPNQKNVGIIRKIRIKRSENRPDFPSYRDNYTQTLRDNPGAQKKGFGYNGIRYNCPHSHYRASRVCGNVSIKLVVRNLNNCVLHIPQTRKSFLKCLPSSPIFHGAVAKILEEVSEFSTSQSVVRQTLW